MGDNILMLGPKECGKTSLLCDYNKEINDWEKEVAKTYHREILDEEEIYQETNGFNILNYRRDNKDLSIFDIGGGMRKYWKEWYNLNHRGIIYVFDVSVDRNVIIQDMKEMNGDDIKSSPLMILITKSDLYSLDLSFLSDDIIGKRKYIILSTNKYIFDINVINWFYDSNVKIEEISSSCENNVNFKAHPDIKKYKSD